MNVDNYIVPFLAILLEHDQWAQWEPIAKLLKKSMSTEEKMIVEAIENLHRSTSKDGIIGLHTIKSYINTSLGKGLSQSQRETINDLIDMMGSTDRATANTILHSIIIQHYGATIAQKLLNKVLTKATPENMDDALKLVEEYRLVTNQLMFDDDISRDIADTDIDDILETFYRDGGIDWFCSALNNGLGQMHRGQLGLVLAPTDTGKTAFILTTAAHIAQNNQTVLHINNEEAGNKVKLRLLKHIGKLDDKAIQETPKEHLQSILYSLRGKYFLYDETRVTPERVEELVKRHNPFLVIVDQASKVQVGQTERDNIRLQRIWEGLREIAKMYDCHVIGVAQAKDYQETTFLGMQNVHGSNVDIQGELDYMLTINKKWPGKDGTINPKEVDKRFLSTPKNKITGNNEWQSVLHLDKQTSTFYQPEPF